MTGIDRPVVIDWQLSSYFGWGVYGINLMLHWTRQQREPLLTRIPVVESLVDLNPVEWALLAPALARSRELAAQLQPHAGTTVALTLPVLHGLGNDFTISAAGNLSIRGAPSIGLTFFESTGFPAPVRERAKSFALIVAGSSWNRMLLERAGIGPTALVWQGVDPTTFHPAPKAGWFAGRFAVFSGGKLEYRKGQDLVLRAFRGFAGRHPEALLVTAWSSPWPEVARTLDGTSGLAPVCFDAQGRLDVAAWAVANGIAADQVLDLGRLPNSAMPRVYREVDVAVFPNRCEGGTNLVAMECMACGVPVILSRNTGHLDLISAERCYPLERQTPLAGDDRADWGESDIEEIVEALEAAWSDTRERGARGARGAAFMRDLSWSRTAATLAAAIAPLV